MKKVETDIVIVGSGAGGATVAKELSQGAKKVILLDQGLYLGEDKFGTELLAYNFYDKHGLWSKTQEGVFYYRTFMAGGTTVVSCSNGVRALEEDLRDFGIDLTEEFIETENEIGIRPVPEKFLKDGTRKIMAASEKLGIPMQPMPKVINFKKCVSCGCCILGCRTGAKWSSLEQVKQAKKQGVEFLEGITVSRVIIVDGHAEGIEGRDQSGEPVQIFARIVILAAGGIGTPIILRNSGIEAGNKLFLDLFTVTIGLTKDAGMPNDIPMAAYYHGDGFLISPFIDTPLVAVSVIPTPLRHGLKLAQREHMLGVMVKIDDDSIGRINADGTVEKSVTETDRKKLKQGEELAQKILLEAGADPQTIITTKVRGAHPGGTAAINEVVDKNLETSIPRLFICDASVLPHAPGLPPILTIVALGKRLSRHLRTI